MSYNGSIKTFPQNLYKHVNNPILIPMVVKSEEKQEDSEEYEVKTGTIVKSLLKMERKIYLLNEKIRELNDDKKKYMKTLKEIDKDRQNTISALYTRGEPINISGVAFTLDDYSELETFANNLDLSGAPDREPDEEQEP